MGGHLFDQLVKAQSEADALRAEVARLTEKLEKLREVIAGHVINCPAKPDCATCKKLRAALTEEASDE